MKRTTSHMRLNLLLSAALLLLLVASTRLYSRHMLQRQVMQAAEREVSLPRQVLWVWERPEDLRQLDPASTGVAVLEETLRLGSSVTPVTRHQPVLMPERAVRIAVVRIETEPNFAAHRDDVQLLQDAVVNLDRVARQPGTAALQIDFDARKSERPFYRRLLTRLRQQMPPTLPLDITALVSWCSTDDWMGDLPINGAIPMFFRMEPDRRRLPLDRAPEYRLREPLCLGSVGVSTAEPWPHDTAGKRIFVFAEHGWVRDTAALRFSRTSASAEHP